MTENEIKDGIKNRLWRLENLYFIKNANGETIRFKLNKIQKILLDNLWFFNIILKARQLGTTTFFCILFLDDTLFNGLDSCFIAHTAEDAENIFNKKIKFAWDRLPKSIKSLFDVDGNNARELRFRSKVTGKSSSIIVKKSGRSDTFQRCHISELSTIDQEDKEKSEEIRTGTIPTVHKGQVIVIESTAKLPSGLFYEYCTLAQYNEKMNRHGEMDWKFFFFPWFLDDEYRLVGDYFEMPVEIIKYFENLKEKYGIILENDQKYWYYKKSLTQKDKMKAEYPSTPDECFMAAVEGTYYARELDRLIADGRLGNVPYNTRYPVDTYWDLGTTTTRKDAMSVVFVQQIGQAINIIDFYGCSGEGFPHLKKVLDERGYNYGKHYAPHDIEVKEIGTGKTRMDIAADIGIRFYTIPKLPFNDGIEAVRSILSRCWFDESKTGGEKGLFSALRGYRKEFDAINNVFKDRPVKDACSDPADAFRMLAIGVNENIPMDNNKNKEEIVQNDTLNVFKSF